MQRFKIKKNVKGQISETLTWVVATIIIIFLISASIYAAVLLGKTKVVEKSKIGVSGKDNENWIGLKSGLAFERNNQNINSINKWLEERDINANS